MRWKCVWPLLLLAGCDQGQPPFDELPLRDALRADPAVLARMSAAGRARLASRFEAARTGDVNVDHLADAPSADPTIAVGKVDRARQARHAEPLLLGVVRDDAAWPICGDDDRSAAPLPPLEGPLATSTADIEAHALTGHAGIELRVLMAATGAQHLERVAGWPSGAVAIDDTIYVNASWLVALAPVAPQDLDAGSLDAGSLDGGLPPQSQASRSATVPTTAAVPFPTAAPPASVGNVTEAVADTARPRFFADAGAPAQTPTEPPSYTAEPTVADDACVTCADGCANSDPGGESDYAGGGSGCEGAPEDTSSEGADDCASSDESGGDACAGSGSEVDASGMESGGCQIAARAKTPKKRGSPPSAWLLAPLGYLFYRRRP